LLANKLKLMQIKFSYRMASVDIGQGYIRTTYTFGLVNKNMKKFQKSFLYPKVETQCLVKVPIKFSFNDSSSCRSILGLISEYVFVVESIFYINFTSSIPEMPQGQEKKERIESFRIEQNRTKWHRTKCFGFLEISFLSPYNC